MQELHKLFLDTSGISTDTRKIEPGCMFVALKGANFNGNSFADEAIKQGAKYVVIDEKEFQKDERYILVDDCLKTLQDLANYHRHQFQIPVIGITGSNGKTSTKELIAAVLQMKYKVLYTQGNLNNHIGVPLTLLQLQPEHQIAVIEMGANKFKDIEELCDIADPNYGIITNIGRAHLEGFGGFEGVLRTKLEMYTAVAKNEGVLFQNGDDSVLVENSPHSTTVIRYGKEQEQAVNGQLIELNPFVVLRWSCEDYLSEAIQTNLIGEYNFYNFLAAITIGRHFDVSPTKISRALAEYKPTNNRSQVEKTEKNTLIIDCYNANPSSMASALSSFKQIQHPNKLAILGEMREMGKEEAKEHDKIVSYLNEEGIHTYLVGEAFVKAAKGQRSFHNTDELIAYLEKEPIQDALVLLKGSRGIQLEKAIPNL